jgi:DNA-binding PadR family transcriptional regulator
MSQKLGAGRKESDMVDSKRSTHDFLPLTPAVFHILLALADGQKHGYGVIVDVRERTAGEIRLGTGTLYTAIKRLLGQGLIQEADGESDNAGGADERRRYYQLLPRGLEVAQAEAARLQRVVSLARERDLLPAEGDKD